jgi:DNA repair protein RadC
MSEGEPTDNEDLASDLAGHRQRLRERFRDGGADALPDYELLELLLFRSIPRRDVKPIAKSLIKRFGSLAEVMTAPEPLLMEIAGVGPGVVTDLKLMKAAARRLARGAIVKKPIVTDWPSVIDYCRASIAYEEREHFHVLFLDKRGALIADEEQQRGTVDRTPVYPREIMRRALELSATAVILFHNHPSGDPSPSAADIDLTRDIARIATSLGVIVLDHIIVTRDGYASFKGLQML